ncbi:fat-like cadherin-related tumor suppressor homolog, partial [Paramuricea clavata]
CAKLAKSFGYRYIGIQSYGECWSGDPTADLFKYRAINPHKCWGFKPHYSKCDDEAETECTGTPEYNYIYELYLTGSKESPCSSLPCYNGGNCTEVGDSFVCKCACGYKGQQCEMKVSPCASAPCMNNGNCTNVGNSFLCKCPCGFKGTRCEKDGLYNFI